MKIPEIEQPEDWYEVEKILSKLMLNLPEFRQQYNKLIKNVDKLIIELAKIDMHLRRNPSVENKSQRRKKLKEINDIIKMFSKMHLLASLAKR